MTTEFIVSGQLLSHDEDKRELYGVIVPYGVEVETARGIEIFEKGSLAGTDPASVILRRRHLDPPTGVGVEFSEDEESALMRFRVSKTAEGDEQLTLAKDRVETGLSMGVEDGEYKKERRPDGRTLWRHTKAIVHEVSTTWRPRFQTARILQVNERENMPDPQEVPAEAPAVSPVINEHAAKIDQLMQKMEGMDERLREFALSALIQPEAHRQELVRKVELRVHELAEVITTDNAGVVPDAIVNEMLGLIDIGRPFLNNTRQVPTPAAGTTLLFPRITQRPQVGVQAAEKDELASRKTIIDTVDFGMITIGGAADLSMQLIRRSSPEFLGLWLELLGQEYATMAEDKALDALLAEAAVVEGGVFDPGNPQLGGAFSNAVAATGRTMRPDRIFLSTAAVSAFMDATEPSGGGGRPLYPGLAALAGISSGDGASSDLSFQLKPVWVPALDDEAVDILVGPSRAFAWAEDGTYTLQADVPAKFGRDVGLAGMIWYAPLYPAAFTSYTIGS